MRIGLKIRRCFGPFFILGIFILGGTLAWTAVRVSPSGLVGYWPFDSISGGMTPDDSGSANNGALFGGPVLAPGKFASAMSFTGTSKQYVKVANQIPNDFTVSLWLKTTSTGPQGTAAFQGDGIVSASATGNAMIPMALLGTKLAFDTDNMKTGKTDTLVSTAAINTGQWLHALVTRAQSTGLKQLFINGTLEASQTSTTAALSANPNISIGGNTGTGHYYTGLLDEVRFYSRVLTSTEITELSHGPPVPAGLTATAGPAESVLKWSAPSGGLLSYTYTLLRATAIAGPYIPLASNLTALTYTDTAVVAGTTYFYVVQAMSSIGPSPDSNQASCTPFAPHITVSPTSVTVVEAHGTTFFTVTLAQPIAGTGNAVQIPITVDPGNGTTPYPVLVSAGTGTPASSFMLVFTGGGALSLDVMVTGQDDNIANNPRPFKIHLGPATSGDPFYNGVNYLPAVTGTQIESDSPGFVINPPSGLVAVDGGSPITFTVQAATIPQGGDVVVNLSLSDPIVATVAPPQLTFTNKNWSSPRIVTVTPLDDHGNDPNDFKAVQSLMVTLDSSPSGDLLYAALPPAGVEIAYQDNYDPPPLKKAWKGCGLVGLEGWGLLGILACGSRMFRGRRMRP